MTRFLLMLLRLVALSLSYAFSTLAAAGFMTFVLFLGSDASWLDDDAGAVTGAIAFTIFMWISIAQLGFVPALISFGILEFGRISSLLSNLVAGGVCAAAIMVLLSDGNSQSSLPDEASEIWIAALAAGFVGGLSHWLLAGFRAGRWLGPLKNSSAYPESDH